MFGASGPPAMEEKRTAIEMMGIQEGTRGQDAILRSCHGEANFSDGLNQRNGKNTWNVSMAMDVYGVLYITK